MKAHEITQACANFASQLDAFLAAVRARAGDRFVRDLTTRRPSRKYDGELVEAAITDGVARAYVSRHNHGVESAVELSLAMLTEVNAHRLGQLLEAEARREGLNLSVI